MKGTIKQRKSLTFLFVSSTNNPLDLFFLHCRASFVGLPFQSLVLGRTHQKVARINLLRLLLGRLVRVYLSWAHHGRFTTGRGGRRLRDQVQPGLPLLGERGRRALWSHRTDGGGQRTVGATGDWGGVGWRKGALNDKDTTVKCYILS